MQFRILTRGQPVDVQALDQVLYDSDPSVVVDFDKDASVLRVSTSMDNAELLGVINGAGLAVATSDLQRLPSECCGGCSG